MKRALAVAVAAGVAFAALAAPAATETLRNVKVGDNYFVRDGSAPTVTVSRNTRVKWLWRGDSPHNVIVDPRAGEVPLQDDADGLVLEAHDAHRHVQDRLHDPRRQRSVDDAEGQVARSITRRRADSVTDVKRLRAERVISASQRDAGPTADNIAARAGTLGSVASAGTLDTSFSGDGRKTINFGGVDSAAGRAGAAERTDRRRRRRRRPRARSALRACAPTARSIRRLGPAVSV